MMSWNHFDRNKTVECVIDGVRQPYDACASGDLEDAIKSYYNAFKYIGSNDGVIYIDGIKNDFKKPHHFFVYMTDQEKRQRKITELMKIVMKF